MDGGEHAFTIRAALAALSSPTYGVYSGFELFENVPLRPGSEEYLNSEKYEYRPRDLVDARNEGRGLSHFLRRLNEIRRDHPALQQLRDLTIHHTDNDNLLALEQARGGRRRHRRRGDRRAQPRPAPRAGGPRVPGHAVAGSGVRPDVLVHEEITGADWTWWQDNFVQLNPWACPVHVLHVRT